MMASRWRGSIFLSFFLVHFGFLIVSCGNRIPPPGGPVDQLPPRIVTLDPDSNATGIAPGSTVRIGFDEEIVTVRGNKGVSLLPVHAKLKMKHGWDYIELRPEGGFHSGCTYCVHLSKEIVDLRGNPLEDLPAYCFSTGDSIYTGIIKGHVEVSEDLGGDIYFQATHLPDTLIYRIGVSSGSSFSLTHLPRGNYHLLVYSDVDRDSLYDPDIDPGHEKESELSGEILEVDFYLESGE
jgi:hypothetical protein